MNPMHDLRMLNLVRLWHASAWAVLLVLGSGLRPAVADPPRVSAEIASRRNCVVVTPGGPRDGGDFGPLTPGTKTSGIQEALDQAKAMAKDVYLCGGSWTAEKTTPVVYHLQETLHVPWMQNFRLDSGHCVINYDRKTGDAVVFDSQMSCYYRFGLIVSAADGAVVRLRPTSKGPDRFKVITTSEFHFNALVGGGGAWPGGEPYNSKIDQAHTWHGIGLALDGKQASINGNDIQVIEIVGCNRGIELTGNCTNNWIRAPLVHLCQNHLVVGSPTGRGVRANRIEAFMNSEGIANSLGALVYGEANFLTLSVGTIAPKKGLILKKPAKGNLIMAANLAGNITNETSPRDNLLLGAGMLPPSRK